jgi:hypothetical protein
MGEPHSPKARKVCSETELRYIMGEEESANMKDVGL